MDVNEFAIIITYCSKDKAFIYKNIEQCLNITKNVFLSCGTHLHTGENEDFDHLRELKNMYNIDIIIYDVDLNEFNPLKERPKCYFNNKSRICGYMKALNKVSQIKWFLFIDADEIPEGIKLKFILQNTDFDDSKNYTFSTYWYYRDPIYQSLKIEDTPLMLHKNNISIDNMMVDLERYHFSKMKDKTIRGLLHPVTNKPVFHHYSWVRSKENMFKKIRGWAHEDDIDWKKIIEDDFMNNFTKIEPIYGSLCIEVDNIFDISGY